MRFSDDIRKLMRNYLDLHRHTDPSFPLLWMGFRRPYWLDGLPLPKDEELDVIFKEMIKRHHGNVDYSASILEGKQENIYIL